MVDMVDSIEVNEKHLLIKIPTAMNTTLLTNKSINFNVYIFQEDPKRGNCDTWQNSLYKNNLYVRMFPSDQQKSQLTSLCPSLGKRYAEIYLGICPTTLQNPFGKTLPVSFIGSPPNIIYTSPIRGSDFLVMEIFANMFGFRPAFHPEESFPAMTFKVLTFIL